MNMPTTMRKNMNYIRVKCLCGATVDWDLYPIAVGNGKFVISCDDCGNWCEGDSALDVQRLWDNRLEIQS